jgi:cytoskeletal protein RodZ
MVIRKTVVKRNKSKKKVILLCAGVVVLLLIALVVSELTNTTYLLHERKAVSSTIAPPSTTTKHYTKPDDEKATAPSTAPDPAPTPSAPSTTAPKEGDATSATNNAPLIEPYGNFVSNHAPGKNGSPSTETSVCLTTPGAKCYIAFTSADNPAVVKTLAAGTADGNGAVYWNNWDVKAAGFTNGVWHIKAVATLNGQTKTTTDAINFEVQL